MRLRHRFGSSLSRGFNPRICKRCDCSTCVFWASVRRFNPRICKRCDRLADTLYLCGLVSIHASVKDATWQDRKSGYPQKSGFNPRICKRCDAVMYGYSLCSKVSIHASVKDATVFLVLKPVVLFGFNPRICKRCDPALGST